MNWKDKIAAAHTRITPHVRRTPVATLTLPGWDSPIEMKFEQMQHTGTFKARGAFNSLLSGAVPKAGIVAASGGNHGAAVAYAASQLGHNAAVFVPQMAGPAKIDLIRRAGADLRVVQGAYADALEAALAYEAETGAMQIHAYDGVGTVTGQGTVLREWEEQGLAADTVLIAVGGGGLIGGSMAWTQGGRKIVAVEPETSCALHAALDAGEPVDVDVSGIAANALGARRIGNMCFDLATRHLHQSVLVTDEAISDAQKLLWQGVRQHVEPAGATALAALLSGAYKPAPQERIAVLICGANPAPDPFS
ncbi:threonine/serine dehydratase [Aliiroseovarius crassostreae]|uniref:threonine/serine dehydratase n=1 Tax=Aliiroseovarius crassostreae TaxID=154981 RepID=UPI0022025ADD|nr:threonine/serine dehydratase [Aliiroseovarius crassostreae]UWQ04472.1 threonine/serine dehydratase [Aliiroseovarius crassostreae]